MSDTKETTVLRLVQAVGQLRQDVAKLPTEERKRLAPDLEALRSAARRIQRRLLADDTPTNPGGPHVVSRALGTLPRRDGR